MPIKITITIEMPMETSDKSSVQNKIHKTLDELAGFYFFWQFISKNKEKCTFKL